MTVGQSKPEWIDADAHILEPRALWEYVDKEFRDRIRLTQMTDDREIDPCIYDVSIDGNPIPIWIGNRQERFDALIPSIKKRYKPGSGWVPEQYLKDLDLEGIDQAVIYPTLFLWATWIPQLGARFGSALARAYNDWIYDFCAADRRRLKPVAVISLHDVESAIREVRRVADRGFVGVFVRPNPMYGRTLGHPDYHPLYKVMEELRLPLGIHEGQISYLPTLGLDRTNARWGIHAMSHPFEQMAAMVSLVEHSVFDMFPKLHVLFLEAGTALWVPYWLNRLDAGRHHYRATGGAKGLLPSECFNRQGWVTCEVDDPYLKQTLEIMHEDRLLMSTDYPHQESPYPNSVKIFLEQKISEKSRTLIGTLNARAAYPRLGE